MSRRSWVGLAAATVTGLLAFGSLFVFQTYGLALFLASPFLMGFNGVVAASAAAPASRRTDLGLAALCGAAPFALALAIGVEGFICVAMALPLSVPLAMLGGLVAHRFSERRGLASMMLAPLLAGSEAHLAPPPRIHPITTSIEIDAPPSAVWKHVVSFTELPPPDEWIFRAGVAYPIRAEIEGAGPGAIRRCVFSTGPFVEPITEWDEPRRLAFSVTAQPPTMRELSPYDIEPPHLEGYFVSQRGQFELVPLPGNRTRLEGTTWYSNRMWPGLYWRLWSDHIIHKIHLRVLQHIRERTLTSVTDRMKYPDGHVGRF